MQNLSKRILYSLVLLATVSGGIVPVPAQRAAKTQPTSAKKCSGAWTGTVSYTRTQSMSDTKTEKRVSGRGEDTRNFEMRYNYSARVSVVESPEMNGSSIARGTVNHEFTSTDTTQAVEKNSCDRGKTWRDMTGTFKSQTSTTGTGDVEANVSIGVNSDGTYAVSIGLPPIQGTTTGSQSASFSGQCTPKEGKNLSMPSTPTSIDGNSLTSDGTHRVNPDDPNRLSGSFTRTWQNVTETITWNLQKCGAPLRLIDLKFEEMKFPDWDKWVEIAEQKGTIDGNLVKIKARVLNASGETKYADVKLKETYKGDKWDGARPDSELQDLTASVRIEPGEEREVEFTWDSSGYAWFDDGRPRMLQRIKAELEENGKKVDEMTKNLKVAPKPVVLVHGLWSNWKAWESWQNILTTSHSYDWKAFPVGEKPDKGVMNTGGAFLSTEKTNTIFENSQQLGKYIRYAQEDRNAWHVDIVAHSMGGLISRHYIHHFMPPVQDGRPQVAHLVMLGTPNMGSPCADVMNTVFETLGKNVEAVRQLRQDVAAEFNSVVTNRKGVKYSVLAGDPLPVMCKNYVWNDGVVPVQSAKWQIKDNATSKSIHTDLTGTADFSNFVKPRLAIGPKGNHMPEAPELPQYPGRIGRAVWENAVPDLIASSPRLIGAGYGADEGPKALFTGNSAPFAKGAIVPKGGSVAIDLPVKAARDLGLTFMAAPYLTATLIDPSGKVVGKNEAGTPESRAWFRSIHIDRGVSAGNWKLIFENVGPVDAEAIVTFWTDANK